WERRRLHRIRARSAARPRRRPPLLAGTKVVSGANPEPPTPMFWDTDHWETEEYLRASGAGWTIVRMQDFMEGHLDQIYAPAIETGRMCTAAGDGRLGYVARK